jgi:LPS O-antigen subunit length determinant protein (WzzB/FepE family)
MKPQPHSKKTLIVSIIAIIVLAIVYFYFSGSTVTDPTATLQTQSANVVGTRVLSLLNQIKSLHIDTTIFKDQAYQTLVDYAVEIPELPVGRPNPFAPLPGVQTAPTGANTAR